MTVVSLFQLGAVHEEVSLGFCQALLRLGVDVKVWLHQTSLDTKGDVFSCFPDNHKVEVNYHSTKLNRPAPTNLLDRVLEDKPEAIILLTLQNSQTEFVANYFSGHGVRVAGIVHNNMLTIKNKNIAHGYNSGKFCPIFLSSHVKVGSSDWNTNDKSFVVYNVFTPALSDYQKPRYHVFSILGGVSLERLAYDELLQSVTENKARWAKTLKIQIVGGGGDRVLLQQLAERGGVEDMFLFSTLDSQSRMTSYSQYYNYLSASDAVLCLPRKGRFGRLAASKITSSVPSALSFGKPLVCTSELAQRHNVSSASVTGDNLSSQINNMLDEHDAYLTYSHLNQSSERLRVLMENLNVNRLSNFLS